MKQVIFFIFLLKDKQIELIYQSLCFIEAFEKCLTMYTCLTMHTFDHAHKSGFALPLYFKPQVLNKDNNIMDPGMKLEE